MQADDEIDEAAAMELKKKRTFRKFTYRGIDLDNLLDLTPEQLIDLVHARARRRLHRGLKKKGMALLKKVRSSTALVRQLCASDGGSAAGNGGAGNGGAAARMVPRRRWPHAIAAKAAARPPRRHRFSSLGTVTLPPSLAVAASTLTAMRPVLLSVSSCARPRRTAARTTSRIR